MSEPLAYWNGQFLPQPQLRIPITDAGFTWGATVSDLCRTFRHRLFRLDDHLQRFLKSIDLAAIGRLRLGQLELSNIAQRLVEANARLIAPDQDLILAMFATPGEVSPQLQPAADPTLGMYTNPIPAARCAPLFEQGAELCTPSVRRLDASILSPAIKHRSRLHWWVAEQEVRATQPYAHALFLDREGYMTETATANLLIVRDGQVMTPSRSRVLPGISLQVTQAICERLNVPFAEADLRLEDCLAAKEAMLASTPYGLAPVARIESRNFDCPGPMFRRLMAEWNRLVGLDIWEQICGRRKTGLAAESSAPPESPP